MRLAPASALVVGLALAACSVPRIVNDSTIGAETLFWSAAGGRDLRTVVVGNPFAVPQPVTDAGIASALQGSFRIPTHVTVAPTADTRPQTRLVVSLDGPPDPGALCSAQNPQSLPRQAPGSSQLRATMAFCEGPSLYAEARGEVERPAAPDDPRLRNLLRQMAFVLIPHDADLIRDNQDFTTD